MWPRLAGSAARPPVAPAQRVRSHSRLPGPAFAFARSWAPAHRSVARGQGACDLVYLSSPAWFRSRRRCGAVEVGLGTAVFGSAAGGGDCSQRFSVGIDRLLHCCSRPIFVHSPGPGKGPKPCASARFSPRSVEIVDPFVSRPGGHALPRSSPLSKCQRNGGRHSEHRSPGEKLVCDAARRLRWCPRLAPARVGQLQRPSGPSREPRPCLFRARLPEVERGDRGDARSRALPLRPPDRLRPQQRRCSMIRSLFGIHVARASNRSTPAAIPNHPLNQALPGQLQLRERCRGNGRPRDSRDNFAAERYPVGDLVRTSTLAAPERAHRIAMSCSSAWARGR